MTAKTNMGTGDNRTINDGKYIIVFCAILSIWLVSCGSVLYCTDNNKSGLENKFDIKSDLGKMATTEDPAKNHSVKFHDLNHSNSELHYKKAAPVFIWASIVFYSSLLIGVMSLMHHVATLNPPGLLIISFLLIAVPIYYRITMYSGEGQQLELIHTKIVYRIAPDAVLFVFSLLALIMVTRSKEASAMGSMWKKTFMYYYTFPNLFTVGLGTHMAIIRLNIFNKIVLERLTAKNMASNVAYWLIYSGNVYMIVLTNILGRMIISATAANYWNENSIRSPISLLDVQFQKIAAIFRYQFGSACYKATYTSAWFTVLIGALLGCDFVNAKIDEVCLIFVLLLMLTVDYTVLFIAMFGLRASEAHKQVVRLFVKFPKILVLVCQNLWSTTFLIFLPTSCFMLMVMWGLDEHDQKRRASYLRSLLVALPQIIVLGTMEDTRSICIMRENAEKDAAINTDIEAKMNAEKKEITDEKSAEESTQVVTDPNTKLYPSQNN